MNLPSSLKRALLRSIAITAKDSDTELRDALESLLTARVTAVSKGSSNKVLIASSRNGQSVSYTLPSGSNIISDGELSAFYGECLDCLDYVNAQFPEIANDATDNLVTKMLEQAEFTSISYFTRGYIQ